MEDDWQNIWIAAGDGDFEQVKGYIESGTPIDAQDEHGYSAL